MPQQSGYIDDDFYYVQQIEVLTAGKTMVTEEMLKFEKQFHQMKINYDVVVKEKEGMVRNNENLFHHFYLSRQK
jgi:hypothetical protein